MRLRTAFAVCLTLAALCLPLAAQPSGGGADEFGTTDGNDLWIPASQFVAEGSAVGHWLTGLPATDYYIGINSHVYALAPVALPQGALVDGWDVMYYDNSATNDIQVELVKTYGDTTNAPTIAFSYFGNFVSSGTPGYATHHQASGHTIDLREPAPATSVTRDQAVDSYRFYLSMQNDNNLAFRGVRLTWHRQVSPAPASPTFNDVPVSDPAFQYVEALVASGITAGCGSGNFCPNASLTRRQMAVFLAKALGLHWPSR